jgi:hypothetical protein
MDEELPKKKRKGKRKGRQDIDLFACAPYHSYSVRCT